MRVPRNHISLCLLEGNFGASTASVMDVQVELVDGAGRAVKYTRFSLTLTRFLIRFIPL